MTKKELIVIKSILRTSNGYTVEPIEEGLKEVINENITFFDAEAIEEDIKMNHHQVIRIMSSLFDKGIINSVDDTWYISNPQKIIEAINE